MFNNGDRVWVRILAGPNTPEALSPGIVTDARVQDREVVRSQTKGGRMTLPNTVVVVSYRKPPTRAAFYTSRPEQIIGLFDRDEHLPVIDGKEGTSFEDLLPMLVRVSQESLDKLTPAPVAKAIAEAAKEYASEASLN